MSESEAATMTRVVTLLDRAVSDLAELGKKVDNLKDEKVAAMESEISDMKPRLATLERVVYWIVAAIGLEMVTGGVALIVWLIQKESSHVP